ncbi:MAG: hypothetical protein KDA42_17680, partial [Planctomycetales bacterium]|nr:hypothetical protein [Planctomycetales bacterium]
MASKRTLTPSDLASATPIEADVLAGCRDGDRGAQQRLYEQCSHRVHRLMVRMVGWQDATDLTQQVFLQVFRKIDQFAGQARFET